MATALPVALLSVAVLTLPAHDRIGAWNIALLAGIGLLAVLVLRRYFHISDVDAKEAQTWRFVFILPLWLRVMKVTMAHPKARDFASKLLIVNGIGAAITGVGYRYGLIRVRLVFDRGSPIADPLAGVVTRSSGAFGNPNLFGSMLLVTALLAVFVVLPRSNTKGLMVLVLTGAGALTSGSRWSVFAIGLTAIAALGIRSSRLNRFYSEAARLIVIVLIGAVAVPGVLAFADRFDELGASNRWTKSQIGVAALTKGIDTLLVGGRTEDLVLSLSDQGKVFSDNGWLQMPLSVGLPIGVAVLVNSWFVVRWGRRHLPKACWIVLGLFTGTMLLNSANLWDPWILSMCCLYWIVYFDRVQRGANPRIG